VSATASATTFTALGTTAVVVAAEPDATHAAVAAAQAEIAAVDAACSRFRADSDLSRVNRAAGSPVVVSAVFLDAVAMALRAARVSDGVVVPTIGRTLRLLGYDRDFTSMPVDGPLPVQVAPAPPWQLVTIDRVRSTVRTAKGVELDLGATAKAWCADRAARAAAEATGAGVLVSLGGDVGLAGPAPSGGWPVRVTDDHASLPDAAGQSITVHAGGVATSGVAARRWQRGGVPLHHLVDPSTGWPVATVWRTVTVAAASCLDANIASTAAMIIGSDGPNWLARQQLPARLVAVDGSITTVGGWPGTAEHPVS
jgi:thiamine biosynthesis lipoprotein